jgi:hypothetical protein
MLRGTSRKADIRSAGHGFYGTPRYSRKPANKPYREPVESNPHAQTLSEIWGSHGGEDDNVVLLDCNTV